jgi:serine/threonine-protein kinase TTK/MPS1
MFHHMETSLHAAYCPQVGRASDIWSLGCILYQMVYGRTPFFHLGNMIQKMHAITNPDYHIDFPPTANPDLLHTMQRCLDRNPRTRATMQV